VTQQVEIFDSQAGEEQQVEASAADMPNETISNWKVANAVWPCQSDFLGMWTGSITALPKYQSPRSPHEHPCRPLRVRDGFRLNAKNAHGISFLVHR
jgi:hypothetical protein